MTIDDAAKSIVDKTIRDLDEIVDVASVIAEKVHLMITCEASRLHAKGNSLENLKEELANIFIKEVTQRFMRSR